jgi:gas vesicle protein
LKRDLIGKEGDIEQIKQVKEAELRTIRMAQEKLVRDIEEEVRILES